MANIPPANQFWAEFYQYPAAVKKEKPKLSYSKQTDILQAACADILSQLLTTGAVPVATSISSATADFAFESPLTPREVSVTTSWLGDWFEPNRVIVCRCRERDPNRCRPEKSSDWLEGPCGRKGEKVIESICSYIHVSLSRNVSSVEKLMECLGPLFREERLPLRVVPGTTSVAIVAATKWEEKHIHKLLRSNKIKLELGLRIFRITSLLVPDHPGDVV